MAALLAAMIAVVGVATVRQADGTRKAGSDRARPSVALETHPPERPAVGQ
jgi:hypothetical protein